MIPAPIRKHIGDEIVRIMLSTPMAGNTKDENARAVLRAITPYIKRASEHSLSTMYVSALFKLRQAHLTLGKGAIHLRGDMRAAGCPFRLTDDEWTNFGKLRYWGLAVHADKENSRSGYWTITTRGGEFLRGEIDVQKKMYTFAGHPLHVAAPGKLVNIRDYKELPNFETYFDFVQPKAPARKSITASIFG